MFLLLLSYVSTPQIETGKPKNGHARPLIMPLVGKGGKHGQVSGGQDCHSRPKQKTLGFDRRYPAQPRRGGCCAEVGPRQSVCGHANPLAARLKELVGSAWAVATERVSATDVFPPNSATFSSPSVTLTLFSPRGGLLSLLLK